MTRSLAIIVNVLILALAIFLITLGLQGFSHQWNQHFGGKRPASKPEVQKPPPPPRTGKKPTLRLGKKNKGKNDPDKGITIIDPPPPDKPLPYKPNSWRQRPSKIEPPSSQRKKKKPNTPDGITEVWPPKKRYRKKVDNDKADKSKMGDPNRTMCVKQLKTLQTAVLKYAMMHDGMAPDSEKLLEALGEVCDHPVDDKSLECPLGHRYLYLCGGKDIIRGNNDTPIFRCSKHSVSITVQGKYAKKEK